MGRFRSKKPKAKPNKRNKTSYDRDNLKRAYDATQSGMSVFRAARVYSVPESTLRDRTRNKIDINCKEGTPPLFTPEEERKLVDHIVYMGNIGYGYSLTDLWYMAAEFGRSIGKRIKSKSKEKLSQSWLYAFLRRWPNSLKAVHPQKLDLARAKSASKEAIDSYFQELNKVMTENNLMSSPERIYNIDESGFSTEHCPPTVVCGKDTKPQAVTSPRTKNVTIIGGANALGNYVPPFYIFPGKRWCDGLLNGAPDGRMSESGWINRDLFTEFVTQHLAKHAKIEKGENRPVTLILYDGHRSHLSLTLTQWAKEHSVILFVLPPHSSHLTQPLDVGIFGPMKTHYYSECKAYMHMHPGVSITRYEVAQLTARPYMRAFCPENIKSGFKKAGIYPFNVNAVTAVQTAPATIYPCAAEATVSQQPESTVSQQPESTVSQQPESTSNEMTKNTQNDNAPPSSQDFFKRKEIRNAVERPKKRFVPPYKLTGNLMSDNNISTLQTLHNKREAKVETKAKASVKTKKPSALVNTTPRKVQKSPKPSTSGHQKTTGAPLNLATSDSSSEEEDDESCCVCNCRFPKQLRNCTSLVIVKWGQCDSCGHWVHLSYCTKVRVLRRDSTFRCVHCPELEE